MSSRGNIITYILSRSPRIYLPLYADYILTAALGNERSFSNIRFEAESLAFINYDRLILNDDNIELFHEEYNLDERMFDENWIFKIRLILNFIHSIIYEEYNHSTLLGLRVDCPFCKIKTPIFLFYGQLKMACANCLLFFILESDSQRRFNNREFIKQLDHSRSLVSTSYGKFSGLYPSRAIDIIISAYNVEQPI